jgi:predicted RNase H-like nuclease
MLAGADGYKMHWVVVFDVGAEALVLSLRAPSPALSYTRTWIFSSLMSRSALPKQAARSCDRLARAMIGLRRNSVFPAPIRPMPGAACQPKRAASSADHGPTSLSKVFRDSSADVDESSENQFPIKAPPLVGPTSP